MIEAVVFDLDDVIVDSAALWERVRRQVVIEHGGQWHAETLQRLVGMGTSEWATYLSRDLAVGLPPNEIAAMVIERMRTHYQDRVHLMPGAAEAIRLLAARWPLGLASSSPPALIDAVLDGAGLRKYFVVALSTEQVDRDKPAPDIYLAAADQLGSAPGSCIAIEDSTNGLNSALSAGLQVIAVPRQGHPPDPEALQAAKLVLTSLAELTAEIIEEL